MRPGEPTFDRFGRGLAFVATAGEHHLAAVQTDGDVHDDRVAVAGHTTMIYTYVLNRRVRGVRSPADGLARRPGDRMPETACHAMT
jgi:hypothetical protein